MKLGIIKHIRCGEDSNDRTLVWLPDIMTEDSFRVAIAAARAEYLAFAKEFKNAEAPNDYRPHSPVPYERHPDRTVADVKAEWAEKRIVWEAWEAQRKKAAKTFGDYIDGIHGIQRFWEFDPPFTEDCDWGHNHGIKLDYANTEHD